MNNAFTPRMQSKENEVNESINLKNEIWNIRTVKIN